MSKRILKALMQLFAIIAEPHSDKSKKGRNIVESFLNQQLNHELVDEYLRLFDGFFALYQKQHNEKEKKEKKLSLSSVKVLKICTQINKELDIRQKVVVLVRLLEFIKTEKEISFQELEFVLTVADIFHFSKEEYKSLNRFVISSFQNMPFNTQMLIVNDKQTTEFTNTRHLFHESLHGNILIFYFKSANIYLFRYFGEDELYLNGHITSFDKVYVLTQGSTLRTPQMNPIYYSDIINAFFINELEHKIQLVAKNIEYEFKGGKKGLNDISFVENSGQLIGIMGASGSGKSTLLNVLNGSYPPTKGTVSINGINIYKNKEKIDGLIGFVSQDDLLIEELSVYQNLYFNAKLCFGNLNAMQINRKVFKTLRNLGLSEIKDMVVGNPLNKKISGGQRKRLNIALELIREPAILFLDEPTSGLSSRDSENIMDLLKELTLKGKLIFTVIHQPSSDIFKMFDKLFILDQGGYLIYNGNPVSSIVYFKSKMHQANWNDSECRLCGNVNPEQIFNIVESQTLDEYGNITKNRNKTPKEWHEHFLKKQAEKPNPELIKEELPPVALKIPKKIRQFQVFVSRDVLSKLANIQYLIINLFEAPLLAFLLSFIIKYYKKSNGYSLMENSNLPIYIFMAVIVAIFIGLTVSAEEIVKDRKILKRERFLNLSRSSYLFSKIAILLILSAFQAFLFVLIGNSVLQISGMFFHYWLMLFSTWFFANLLGLNISDGFDTVVTIYILIPFLVIPQLILSGIIVSFDKLNPNVSNPSNIPIYGEIITARWAYEGLAVQQFKANKFQKQFYYYDKALSVSDFKKNYWVNELFNKLSFCERNYENPNRQLEVKKNIELLKNEIEKELKNNPQVAYNQINSLVFKKINPTVFKETKEYLNNIKRYYIKVYNKANKKKDKLINELQNTSEKKAQFLHLKKKYTNEALSSFVRNTNSVERLVIVKNQIYQKIDPIYKDPEKKFIKAHFYAPSKYFFGKKIDTYWVNLWVIWLSNLLLYLSLHFRLLRRGLEFIALKTERFQRKKLGN